MTRIRPRIASAGRREPTHSAKVERMVRAPAPLPRILGDAFSVARAREAGVTGGRLRSRDLDAPFWGVRIVRAPDAAGVDTTGLIDDGARRHRAAMIAYAQRMPEHFFFIGLSALVGWCDLLPAAAPCLEVGTLLPHRAPRGAGIRGRQFADHLVTVRNHEGLRLTSPASTWIVLARTLPLRDLVAVGCLLVTAPRGPGGVRLGPSLTTLDALRAATAVAPRTGVAAARRGLELIRPGARSRPEVHLWLALVDAGLPEPDYDVDVRDASGRLIGTFDLGLPGRRVLVEYQGDYHRLTPEAWARDIAKRQRAREEGYTVVEVTRREMYPDTAPAVARIARALVLPQG